VQFIRENELNEFFFFSGYKLHDKHSACYRDAFSVIYAKKKKKTTNLCRKKNLYHVQTPRPGFTNRVLE